MASKAEEKKQAYTLFVHGGLTFKEISEIIKTSRATLSRWNIEENWEAQKASLKVTREKLIQQYYLMLAKINEDIAAKGGVPDAKDADKIYKIQGTITALDRNYDLASYNTVLQEMVTFINDTNPEHAKTLGAYMLDFIKEKAKKLK